MGRINETLKWKTVLKWKSAGKNRPVDPKEVRELETRKFKARGELLSSAACHPSALSGYFLATLHQKLSHGILWYVFM